MYVKVGRVPGQVYGLRLHSQRLREICGNTIVTYSIHMLFFVFHVERRS